MPKIRLQNISKVKLLGKLPGSTFMVDADEDGNPTEMYWIQRLEEERLFKVGAVVRVPSNPAPAPTPEVSAEASQAAVAETPAPDVPASPSTSKKKA
jgi:hypothetical protein